MGWLWSPLAAPTNAESMKLPFWNVRRAGKLSFLNFLEICVAASIRVVCLDGDETLRLQFGSHPSSISSKLGFLCSGFPRLV